MAAPQIGSIPHLQRRYLRQRHLPTAKLVRLRARPRGLMQRVRQNSTLRSAQFQRKAGAQQKPQKKEQTLYHRPGAAGIAPTAVGINTEAASAAQKPAAEKAAKKPFVPLTGRTPESIPSHLDLHEASQKTTKRPQKNTQEVASDE